MHDGTVAMFLCPPTVQRNTQKWLLDILLLYSTRTQYHKYIGDHMYTRLKMSYFVYFIANFHSTIVPRVHADV